MRNVVIFLEKSSDINRVGANLLPHLSVNDRLIVLMELPDLQSNAMPLIGDLKEIRYRKAIAQLDTWHKDLSLEIKGFKPIVFNENITQQSLVKELLEIGELTVFGMPFQETYIRKLFDTLNNKVKLNFIFSNGQMD